MLTTTLENVLNRGLPRSPRAQKLCAELAGRKLAVEISGIGRLLLESTGASLKVSRAPTLHEGPGAADPLADASITGGPFSLLALAAAAPEATLRRGDVEIGGDAELAEKFHELTRLLRPDPEEELSLVLGDVPAHQIGRLTRATLAWGRKAAATMVRNIAEYLAHERGDLVPRREADAFMSSVDSIREDVDRVAARIDILIQHRP